METWQALLAMENSPCVLVDNFISDQDIGAFPEILAYGRDKLEGFFAQCNSGYLPWSVSLFPRSLKAANSRAPPEALPNIPWLKQ
jgi:hypothetical protein